MKHKNSDASASQARRAASQAKNEEEVEPPRISPEEWRKIKIMEALNEAAKNKRLREEYERHRAAERKFNV